MYSPQVLDHFEHPRNSGDLPDVTAIVQVENPACGDVMLLAARISEGMISEVRFKAKGCVSAIACGSVVTELVAGQSIERAGKISQQQIAAALGGLSRETMHASHLAAEALQELLKKIRHSA